MPTPLPKLEKMTDILDLKEMKVWDLAWLEVLILILLGLIALWVLVHFWNKRKGKVQEVPKTLTPLEYALGRLHYLVQRGLVEAGRVRQFYFTLSEIFREFLEKEIQIGASEATLEELKAMLKECSDFTQEEIREAIWLLETCDLAKFARFIPKKEDILKSVKVCRILMTILARRQEVLRKESQAALEEKVSSKEAKN